MEELEKHYVNRSNWLRASVLGANDGILSTASIAVGVASAQSNTQAILLAAMAGLVAGAFSMAAGEYVSVSSQEDIEKADLEREKRELESIPEIELNELSKIYIERGLTPELAKEVAIQLTQHDALGAHARDELGINEITSANPLQAALASALSFIVGGILPVIVVWVSPLESLVGVVYVTTLLFLILLGYISARLGGSSQLKSIVRIAIWGTLAMAATALVGYIFGVQTV